MVTGPVALVQARVKGWPASTSKLELVKSALALTTAARAPTMARIENFILMVGFGKNAIVFGYGNDG
jgi:phage-related minor tail protein